MALLQPDSSSEIKLHATRPELKFTSSSNIYNKESSNFSGKALFDPQSEAALGLLQSRLSGLSQRWSLTFLLILSLILAWLIGYFQVSPALLVLLVVAALVVGRGHWQQIVQGVQIETNLKTRRKLQTQFRGEAAEWLNFALNRWWKTCNGTVLAFAKDYVEPLLEDLLPVGINSVEVVNVDFREQTPIVSNLRILDIPNIKGRVYNEGSSGCKLMARFDLTVPSPDSQIVLRARLGGKYVGTNHVVNIDGLYLSGTVQAVIHIDPQIPFPHFLKITATFINKPDIWFSVKVLRGLKVTNIPLLKNLIHSIVMDVFTTLLVDPGQLTLNFDPSPLDGGDCTAGRQAEGVITIKVTSVLSQKRKTKNDGGVHRWISLCLGKKKYKCLLPPKREELHATYSFLVYDLKEDVLVVKVKQRGALYSRTLAMHSVGLDSLGLDEEESLGEKSVSVSNNEVDLQLVMSYTVLPSFSLKVLNNFPPVSKQQVCGVLYVHVHGGEGLMGCDSNGLSDPYCLVHANKQKILCTHHVDNSLTPIWEKGVEIFVSDITQVVLTFLVLDWDGPLVGDDVLGMAKLTLSSDCPELIQHRIPLIPEKDDSSEDVSLGHITVSLVFRPVASVGQANSECHVTPLALSGQGEDGTSRRVSLEKEEKSKVFKKRCQDYQLGGHMTHGVMEFQVIRGRHLVPQDSNGLSDPYVVVKYQSRVMFRSKVIKKTLNPEWNETVTLPAPAKDDIIHVECWDKDTFSDDFMGSVQFTQSDLHIFTEGQKWYQLNHVKHGELLLLFSRTQDSKRNSSLDEFVEEVQLHLRESRSSTSDDSCESSSSDLVSSSHQEDSSISPTSDTAGKSTLRNHTSLNGTGVSSSLPSNDHEYDTQSYSKPHKKKSSSQLPIESTADIQQAQKINVGGMSDVRRSSTTDRFSNKEKQVPVYHNVEGQIIDATGFRELGHLELYVKVRLNTRPSYRRQHKFGRGPVIHKTRVLRGSQNLQWKEGFVVKESPIASDSLLTLDLKSGSKVNIGTYAISLDKFFDGKVKATRSLDIGNDVKLRVKMSHQLK